MEKFVHDENIRLYRRLLAEATDTERRRVLLKLLADEEAKDQRPPERKQVEPSGDNTARRHVARHRPGSLGRRLRTKMAVAR